MSERRRRRSVGREASRAEKGTDADRSLPYLTPLISPHETLADEACTIIETKTDRRLPDGWVDIVENRKAMSSFEPTGKKARTGCQPSPIYVDTDQEYSS